VIKFVAIFMMFCFLAGTIVAQSQSTKSAQLVKIEEDRLAFEQLKHKDNIQLEKQKLELETVKAWSSAIALAVPLLVAAFSLALAVWSQRKQAALALEAQEKEAQTQFEIKAAEIALAQDGPHGTRKKARALVALFPNRLPEGFAAKFDPQDFVTANPESKQAKMSFFQAVASNPAHEKELAILWQKLFPEERWTERVVESDLQIEA